MRARSGAARLGDSAGLFAALGDPTRLRLVTRLCESGPQSIVQLTDGSRVSRQAVTKHLRVLETAGLVQETRQGRASIWELERKRLQVAQAYLDQVSRRWDAALDRLRLLVEE